MTTRAESEAEKIRRVPGIEFVDTPTGRMARVAGTGVRVWLIARDFRDIATAAGRDAFDSAVLDAEQRAAADTYRRLFPGRREGPALAALWPWLTAEQIEAALSYYAAYPDEIDRRIAQDAEAARTIA